jgi:alpha-beta hydrolase superfamily lysophospholipase
MQAYLHTVATSCQPETFFCHSSDLESSRRFVHRWWPEEQEPWGALTIIHGFGDHAGRFEGMATSLASFGLAVTAVDLVGHGRSPGRRGVIDSYEQLLDEVERSVGLSRNRWPRIPQFVFGQSMGGNLVINWMLRRRESARCIFGAILGAPLLRAKSMPKEKYMRAGRWLAQRLPNFRVPTPARVEWLCAEPRAQDAYRRDPLVHRTMSLRLATSLIDSGLWAMERAGELTIPSLLIHGSEDRLTCPHATREFAQRASGQAEFVLFPGCRHELHEEPPREHIFETIATWAKSRCIREWVLPASIEGMAQGSYTCGIPTAPV